MQRARSICGALLMFLAVGAASARAQCTYPPLAGGVTSTASATPQPFSFNQSSQYYAAVAVRPAAGEDWNIGVFQAQAAFPACVATSLGSSTRTTGVDFVVGDFNATHNALALYYPMVTRVSGSGNATVEWDDGPNSLTVNGPLVTRTTGAADVIEVWDVFLSAGSTYTFTFNHTAPGAKLLLFKSGAGVYWAGRNSALFETAATMTYAPSASGYYGVVAINDDGVAGSYTLGVGRCETPTALTAGVTASTSGLAECYYSVGQGAAFWTAVGVRGAADWNLEAYASSGGGGYPGCFATQLAASAQASPAVDFIVANFNNQVPGTFYTRVHMNQDVGSGSGTVEWDDGGTLADIIDPEGPPPTPTLSRTTGPTDVLECWDLYMTGGTSYQFFFNTSGANLRLFVFSADLAWGGRGDAILQLTGASAASSYVAPTTGYYGLVVVNEDGGTGSYNLRVYAPGVVAVDDASRPPTRLEGTFPNPARGNLQVRFALHDRGPVAFEVLDVAGRVVSEIPSREWSAGRWNVSWNGRSRSGNPLGAGIYFIRMKVSGRVIALRKVALLD